MKELIRRLSLCPRVAWEILAASFLSNLMSLASSIYVILVLNRYVGYGFDGTLYTLTAGVLVASGLGFAFSDVRSRLAATVSTLPDAELEEYTLASLVRARQSALNRLPAGRHQEVLGSLQQVKAAYDGANIVNVLDAPFMIIFLLAITLIHPLLMFITFLAAALTIAFSLSGLRSAERADESFSQERLTHRNLMNSAIAGAETVRAFLGADFIKQAWRNHLESLHKQQVAADTRRSKGRMRQETVSVLLRVFIYAFGAMLAVSGEMSVGGLIGASILSSKVLQMSSSFLMSFLAARRADAALTRLKEFHSLPLEPLSGTAMREYSGRLEFRDVGFAYSGNTSPLFESMSFVLQPGSIVAITGINGAGKSTFCKLACGLLEPGRGQVLADGIDIRQLAPEWWRRQVLYMPQEPTFLTTTIRANITLADPDPEGGQCQERLGQAVRAAALRRFLDTSVKGLDMEMVDGGRALPLGIRRRISLARALMNPGKLVVFDDPTEGLDAEGCQAVYAVLNALAKGGLTILVCTLDPNILKGARYVLDMNAKPTPVFAPVAEQKPEEA